MATKGNFSQRLRSLAEKLNYRQLIFLAFLVSCLLGLFVYVSLNKMGVGAEQPEQAAVQPIHTKKVVIANQDIPQRAIVKTSMLKLVQVPEEMVPAGAVEDMDRLIGHPASVPIQKGDVVTESKIYADPKMAGFPGMIPPDCRAFSIGISDITGVAGFARPGDYVDVMLIKNKSKNGRLSGEILLQNVMLLGINKSANPPKTVTPAEQKQKDAEQKDQGKEKKDDQNNGNVQASAESMATATLALTPEESLQLAVAMQEGSIYLTLRPLHPKDMFVLKTDYSMLSGDAVPASAPAPVTPVAPAKKPENYSAPAPVAMPASAPSSGSTIEIIRGVDVSNVEVND